VSPAELRAINESLVITSVRLMERVEIAEEQQRRALATGQEEERRRLSRELHDQTGQHLAGLALGLQSLEQTIRTRCAPDTLVEQGLGHLHQVASELARDIHRIAVELRPTALDDLGLIPALESHVGTWSADTGIPAEFESFGIDESRLPEMGKIAIYRVVQEALTNIVRYAGPSGPANATSAASAANVDGQGATRATAATQVSVTLQGFPGHLQATIEDDGPGFDSEAVQHASRLGIRGMRE
jgi:signal transduction histidine kinase